jgi:acylaminoacyl-peptidase
VNIAAMTSVSDIPDWCHAESRGPGTYAHNKLSGDVLQTMYAKSPISFVDNIKTPILILIGAKDRRVPPFNGMELYHYLKAKGVSNKMLIYPDDTHALDSFAAESDACLNMITWFNKIKQI